MLKKELPLKHIKINYDPIIDTPLEIIAQYPDLYEQKIAENGIDTIIYDNDISDNVSFYNITYALNKDCMMFMNLPLEVARFSISNMTDYIIQLLGKSPIMFNFYVILIGLVTMYRTRKNMMNTQC